MMVLIHSTFEDGNMKKYFVILIVLLLQYTIVTSLLWKTSTQTAHETTGKTKNSKSSLLNSIRKTKASYNDGNTYANYSNPSNRYNFQNFSKKNEKKCKTANQYDSAKFSNISDSLNLNNNFAATYNTIIPNNLAKINNGFKNKNENFPENKNVFEIRKRRHIILVSKTIENRRRGRRKKYHHRSKMDRFHRRRTAFENRHGPTGTDALFFMYPELATPEWRKRHGINLEIKNATKNVTVEFKVPRKMSPNKAVKSRQNSQSKANPFVKHNNFEITQGNKFVKSDDLKSVNHSFLAENNTINNSKIDLSEVKNISTLVNKFSNITEKNEIEYTKSPKLNKKLKENTEISKKVRKNKRKLRLQKSKKEEIANFAIENGVLKTIQHYKKKLKIILRPGLVKKYVKRLKSRNLRRKSRLIS